LNDHARLASFHACRWPASHALSGGCDARIGRLAVPASFRKTPITRAELLVFQANSRKWIACVPPGNRLHVEPHEAVIPTTIRGFA
jgi:hypothetical protein